MSVTSLVEIETCPRKWALRNAAYPDIWTGYGYPPNLNAPSLSGTVVHLAVEKTTRALAAEGCTSVRDASATRVIRSLGGFTSIIETSIENTLQRYSTNPRIQDLLDLALSRLRSKIPEMRTQVQHLVGRVRLTHKPTGGASHSGKPHEPHVGQAGLPPGTYSEVLVRAPTLKWKGYIDLLTLSDQDYEILDFKTGQPKDQDYFQMRVYALLWFRDTNNNQTGRLANSLRIVYPQKDVDLEAPSVEELEGIEQDLIKRTSAARTSLSKYPPDARPSPEHCRICSVRHLCDEYWKTETQDSFREDDTHESDFVDIQLEVINRRTPKLLEASVEVSGDLKASDHVLLRTSLEHAEVQVGDHIRVLNTRLVREDQNTGRSILTMSPYSELFIVAIMSRVFVNSGATCGTSND